MRVGLVVPNTHPSLADAELLVAAAQAAERAGWDSVWLNDHAVMPTDSVDANPVQRAYARSDVLDPLVLLGALATATSRMLLGVSVLVLPYRHPLLVAKMVATADVLSRGRVILGVGSGWMREQFDALGVPFGERGAMTDEYIRVLKRSLEDPEPSYEGRFVSFANIRVTPQPRQRPLPMWVGGRSRRGAKRAVEHQLPWHPSHWTDDELRAGLGWLAAEAAAQERPAPPVTFRLRFGREGEQGALLGPGAARAVDQLHELAELGIEHLVVELPAASGEELLEGVERFGTDVLEACR